MKKQRPLAALTALLLLLGGCSAPRLPDLSDAAARLAELPVIRTVLGRAEPVEYTDGVTVYRVAADREAGGELIRPEVLPAGDPEAQDVETLLSLFAAPSEDETLTCALPAGVEIEDWSLDNGVVTLTLSADYLGLSRIDRTVTAFCAVLTLCALDGVEAVTVTADGQTVFAGLMPADAMLDAADADPYVRQLRLYFSDPGGRWLLSEYHSLTLAEDASPERYVVEELLRGPNSGELTGAIPAGTTLLSCRTSDGLCTVDLSAEFLSERPDTALGERLAVYSLVDSLTALSTVDRVRILVEGEAVDRYVYRSLAEPLSRYDEPIGPVSEARGESDTDLYLVLPALAAVAPLPFRVDDADYESRAEAVLAALLGAEEPGYPAVFPDSGSVAGVAVRGSVCMVDLSESFFVSLPENTAPAAVQSMTATLCALPGISAVRFTVGGGPAVFDGTDYSGPWRDYQEIEVS